METLASRIARAGALRDTDAVGWIVRLAKRIEHLHARGVVHGRISPECVVMQSETCTSNGWLSNPPESQVLASYHSPERARGDGPSRRDDTWALAVTLHEALTAQLPFAVENDPGLLLKSGAGEPRPTTALATSDGTLRSILERALAPDVVRRLSETAELRRALELWQPKAKLAQLPALEDPAAPFQADGDLAGNDDDDDDDDDDDAKTLMMSDVLPSLRQLLAAQLSPFSDAMRSSEVAPPPDEAPPGSSSGSASSQMPRLGSSIPPQAPSSPPPRLSSSIPPRASASQQPARLSSSIPPRKPGSLPPQSASSVARRTPLQGLSNMGLRQSIYSIAPAALSSPPSASVTSDAPKTGAEDSPAAESKSPTSPTPPLESATPPPESVARGHEEITKPTPARDLPSLVDDELPPEPSDPFAQAPYHAWTQVGPPNRGAKPGATSPAPAPELTPAAPPPRPAPARSRKLALVVGAVVLVCIVAAWLWRNHERTKPSPRVEQVSAPADRAEAVAIAPSLADANAAPARDAAATPVSGAKVPRPASGC